MKNVNLLIVMGLLIAACDSKPKVIEGAPMAANGAIGSFKSPTDIDGFSDTESQEHQVKVEEVLNTEKYTFLNVIEDEDLFWIAIPRKEVEVGGTYYYKGGLLKKHFHSKEFDKVFETIYLVSDVIPVNADGTFVVEAPDQSTQQEVTQSIEVKPAKGAITLSELFSNPSKYQGKTVKITGKCVKVNPMIMDRNWVHIHDSSGDDHDLTVTTSENIILGTVVSLEGVIALNKDFGAGYRYDIILEDAAVIK